MAHLGLGYRQVFRSNDTLSFSSPPEAHLLPSFASTGSFVSDGGYVVSPEAAIVLGPFSMQGELTHASFNVPRGPDPDFYGHYLMGSYFLTGEHRNYDAKEGAFGRLRPRSNFLGSDGGGTGAVELALRYSVLDLNDGAVRGGELRDYTLGFNWYLNPFVRLMLNYVHADLEGVGNASILQARAQLDF